MNDTITDYATGRSLPLVGPEGNRQRFEKVLVEEKGYLKEEIEIDREITVFFKGEPYVSTIDVVVFV